MNLPHNSIRLVASTIMLALAAGCSSDALVTPSQPLVLTPAALVAFSGDGQSVAVGSALERSLTVRATTASGAAVTGVTVSFQVTSGTATLSATSAITDSNGEASVQVTAGSAAGTVVVSATVGATVNATTAARAAASFTFTVVATTTAGTCTPTSLPVGGAVVIGGTSACVAADGGAAEYALIPYNASTNPNAKATVSVTATGVTIVPTIIPTSALLGSNGTLAIGGAAASVSGRRAFEVGLRNRERAALNAHLSAARSWYVGARTGTTTGARFNVIPSTATIGSIYSLNGNANDACTSMSYRAGRVMAVGRRAIIVADTLNPSGGFSAAEYQAIADTFDVVVDGVDTRNFGQPTDIDNNGHVILFFTSAVNALTPAKANYYIGGFFYGRDLLPATGASSLGSCAGSNSAEMFYLLVPDPNGTINGNAFSKPFVSSNTIATTAHEYQHLINASRRMYINTAATGFEETWLDEGLAHVAEELVFYARSGLSARTNIDAALLRSNGAYRTSFNDDGISNFDRLRSFLGNPTANSPYAANDSLATRGATWSFLRYAVDQQGTDQPALWYNLVNSSTTGLRNLGQVFPNVTSLFRDWATSLLLDDVSGAGARYQAPSWNLRTIFGALNGGVYPLATQSLSPSAATNVSVAGGGVAYLRFGVPASGTGALTWTTSSAAVQTTLVRLR
jgi:hypothetical protein